jgi:hypothetical protein
MKGYLHVTKEGWFVAYDQRTFQDPSAEDGILPVHTDSIADSSFNFYNGKEVEFEEISLVDKLDSYQNCIFKTYAKLVELKKDFVFFDEHIVDTNKMILDDCEKVKNWDNFAEQKNLELLAEEVYGKGIKPDYEEGFIDGYNKAKESLYTKEQMELCWIAAMSNRTGFNDSVSYTEFIKSLKQK